MDVDNAIAPALGVPLNTLGDPDLTALYAYWIAKRGDRLMPRRSDIKPSQITSLLPDIFILEVHHPLRFRFRLVGTMICQRWRQNNTGRWLDELDFDGQREVTLEQYAYVARNGIPRCDIQRFVSADGQYLHYRRLLLPLSEGGTAPNMLLGSQKAVGLDGYKVALPKWI